MSGKIENIYRGYSPKYWTLILAGFIDRLGGALIFPFFALYVTERFDVGMVEVGKLFAIFAVSGMIGSVLGGALTDKFGRRAILLFGLVFSALGSVLMGSGGSFKPVLRPGCFCGCSGRYRRACAPGNGG